MNKNIRVLISVVIFIVLLLISFLLRNLGGKYSDYSSDVIAILALVIVIWREFLTPKVELKREYHVDPQNLVGRRLDKLKLHVIVQNTGEVDVNLRFAWIDLDNGVRLEFYKLQDSNEKEIDSAITVNAHSFKDLYVVFTTKQDNPTWEKIQSDVCEATNKKDIRILGELSQLGGRLCWYDTTSRAQEVRLPIGSMIKDLAKYKIDNPIGSVRRSN